MNCVHLHKSKRSYMNLLVLEYFSATESVEQLTSYFSYMYIIKKTCLINERKNDDYNWKNICTSVKNNNPKIVLRNEAPSKDQKGKTFPTNPKERIVIKLSMYLIDRKNTSSRQKQSHE